MEPVSTSALALAGMKILSDIMEIYKYEKAQEYKKLLREYERQKFLPFDHIDYSDDVLANLRVELFKHGESFQTHLQSASKKS